MTARTEATLETIRGNARRFQAAGFEKAAATAHALADRIEGEALEASPKGGPRGR